MSALTSTRAIALTREGEHFRLAFSYDPDLVGFVKKLPLADFQPNSKTWLVPVTEQAVTQLRRAHHHGQVEVPVDTLLADGETPPRCAPAALRAGSRTRPFLVALSWPDDKLYARLRAVPSSKWEKAQRAISFPPQSAAALAELAAAGVLADPDGLLRPDDGAVAVSFDTRTGGFAVLGDPRAAKSFDRYFPDLDVVAAWTDKGIGVEFTDTISEEIYRAERARAQGILLHPDGMSVPLHDYQAKDVALATSRTGFSLFHAPGVGKTPAAIGAAWEVFANRVEVPRIVVVVPGALRSQWAEEIARFTPTDPSRIAVIDGPPKKRKALYDGALAGDFDWVIVHYDILNRDLAQLRPVVAGSYLIADEVHRAKTWDAKRAKALRALGKKAARRLGLTGTPVESVPDEWYWVLEFATPGMLGDYDEFRQRHQYEGRFGYEGCRNKPELRRRSQVHYSRWTKKDVAPHLPPLRVERMLLDPDARYTALLKQIHADAADEIAELRANQRGAAAALADAGALDGEVWDEIRSGAEMTAVGMLRLVTTSPRLLHRSDSPSAKALVDKDMVPNVDGPKLDQLRTMATEAQSNGERLVIFSGSKKMVELIGERFDGDGTRYVTFTGDTKRADRDNAVKAFTTEATDEDPGPTCFVATDAAAEGLNLGRCCNTLVNIDLPWTPTRLEQRSNRIHRVDGTHSSYRVVNMTLRGTVEEGIVAMLTEKADLADSLFGERGGAEKATGKARLSKVDVLSTALGAASLLS